jgi:hypothetical protein
MKLLNLAAVVLFAVIASADAINTNVAYPLDGKVPNNLLRAREGKNNFRHDTARRKQHAGHAALFQQEPPEMGAQILQASAAEKSMRNAKTDEMRFAAAGETPYFRVGLEIEACFAEPPGGCGELEKAAHEALGTVHYGEKSQADGSYPTANFELFESEKDETIHCADNQCPRELMLRHALEIYFDGKDFSMLNDDGITHKDISDQMKEEISLLHRIGIVQCQRPNSFDGVSFDECSTHIHISDPNALVDASESPGSSEPTKRRHLFKEWYSVNVLQNWMDGAQEIFTDLGYMRDNIWVRRLREGPHYNFLLGGRTGEPLPQAISWVEESCPLRGGSNEFISLPNKDKMTEELIQTGRLVFNDRWDKGVLDKMIARDPGVGLIKDPPFCVSFNSSLMKNSCILSQGYLKNDEDKPKGPWFEFRGHRELMSVPESVSWTFENKGMYNHVHAYMVKVREFMIRARAATIDGWPAIRRCREKFKVRPAGEASVGGVAACLLSEIEDAQLN